MAEEKQAQPQEEEKKTKKATEQAAIDPTTLKPGMTVKVHQRIKDVNSRGQEKERIQIFEGIILAKRGKSLENCRILVRKIGANNIGVEKLFPLASSNVVKVEPVKQAKVRRAKLYFLRSYKKRLKEKKVA